jgi:L-Ala-D/L-Glu epimerase
MLIITKIEVYKYSIPMHPFTIATGTMHYAQNTLIRIYAGTHIGYGECAAFPMIVGETQNTCYVMAQDFAQLWLSKNALAIEDRMNELHLFTAGNSTIKSAFDMALYDIAAKQAGLPLYKYLGGSKKTMTTDITVGISDAATMAAQAAAFVNNGATILKVKLGKAPADDIARVAAIRQAVGNDVIIRIDANQGWSYNDAVLALLGLGNYNIELCEQPMRTYNDKYLPQLMALSPIKIMADESVYNHHDAERIIENNSCHYINIKFAKSSGLTEANKIIAVATQNNIPCMMGGMLESRVALSCFVHFASANNQIQFYDMDTCMLGHKLDPVLGGIQFSNYTTTPTDELGIGVTVDEQYLQTLENTTFQ